MSNVNDTSKFYQFLAKYSTNGQTWVNTADSYVKEDGIVTLAEFRDFMNNEWNGELTLTNDLITSWWDTMDTNKNKTKISGSNIYNSKALDKTEKENVDKKIEVYIKFEEYMQNLSVPTCLTTTGSAWKSDVRDELSVIVESFVANSGNPNELKDELDKYIVAIQNKLTATYCAVEYLNTLQSVLKDYPNYKAADDEDLKYLLNAAKFENSQDIYSNVKEIIDAYLATAELSTESNDGLLENLGFVSGSLNELQIQVLTQQIKNDLGSLTSEYEGYEDLLNSAIEKFINEKITSGKTFEELKTCAEEFKTSEYKTELDNLVLIEKKYANIEKSTTSGSFYNKLVTAVGKTVADIIADNARYFQVYQDLLADVKTQVNEGKLTMDKVEDYIIEQIGLNINQYLTNGFSDMSISELNSTYDKFSKAANAQTDNDLSLSQHREAAINYCEALVSKNAPLKQAVIDIFGEDYKDKINEMFPGDIKNKMDELKNKAISIGEFSIDSVTQTDKDAILKSIKDTYNTTPGATLEIEVPNTFTLGGTTISTDRISYKVIGNIQMSGNKIYANTTNTGRYTGTITIMVDGNKITEKTVTIICEKMDLTNTKAVFEGKSLAEHMKNAATNIELCSWTSYDKFKSVAKASITRYVNNLVTSLSNEGFDSDNLKKAATTTINYYQACIESMPDREDNKMDAYIESSISYVDGNGKTQKENVLYSQRVRKKESDADIDDEETTKNMDLNSTGLRRRISWKGTDSDRITLNTAVLLTKFQEFYNSL